MALTHAQLVMLDTIIYADFGGSIEGDTVAVVLEKIKDAADEGKLEGVCSMSTQEWKDFVGVVEKDEDLLKYTVQRYVDNGVTGMRAACFVDDVDRPKDVNVVFRGTSSAYEWHDNGQGGYMSETDQQKAAALYVKGLPPEYGNEITVSGHSKGGNKAQYVTIAKESKDRIGLCVSIDGQGFSQEFLDDHADAIRERADRIVSISASNDIVNVLLYPIAGTRLYYRTSDWYDPLHYHLYHKPNILLDSNGQLQPQEPQAQLPMLVHDYTTYLLQTIPEPERSAVVDGLVAVMEKGDAKEDIWQKVYAAIVAGSHVDDYVFNRIGDLYGAPGQVVAVYFAALYCPILFLDDLRECGKEMAGSVLQGMSALASVIDGRLAAYGDRAKEFRAKFVQSVDSFASRVRANYNMMFNRGYQYASGNTLIEVNTASLRSYADRLLVVNKRVRTLSQRMDTFYQSVGLRDLLKLLRADLMNSCDGRIANCAKYLNETANDFEKVEREIAAHY